MQIRMLPALAAMVAACGSSIALAQPARDGRVVAWHDANTLSTMDAGVNESRFAVNVARWLSHDTPGGVLLIEPSTTNLYHNFSPRVQSALADAGFAPTVTQRVDWTLSELRSFSAVFVGSLDQPGRPSIAPSVLREYVLAGGGVYTFAGMGPSPQAEGDAINPFLEEFGIAFDTRSLGGFLGYNGVGGRVEVTSTHAIFEGVTHLQSANGQFILPVEEGTSGAILQSASGAGGVQGGIAAAITIPTPGALALALAGGVLLCRRKR